MQGRDDLHLFVATNLTFVKAALLHAADSCETDRSICKVKGEKIWCLSVVIHPIYVNTFDLASFFATGLFFRTTGKKEKEKKIIFRDVRKPRTKKH